LLTDKILLHQFEFIFDAEEIILKGSRSPTTITDHDHISVPFRRILLTTKKYILLENLAARQTATAQT
jgi:hypothetical protein